MRFEIWNTIFPFFIRIGRDCRIQKTGNSLAKLVPDILHTRIGEKIILSRPKTQDIDFESLLKLQGQLVLLTIPVGDIQLRGQIIQDEDNDHVLLLVSPWFREISQFEQSGLTYNDFAIHDPIMDVLQLLSFYAISIKDLQTQTTELENARLKLEMALKAKRDFLSVMTHELRTPLNAVLGMTYQLLEESPKPSQLEMMDTLKFSGENLLNLVNDILDYSKLEAGMAELDVQAVKIKRLLQQTKKSFDTHAKNNELDLILDLDSQMPEYVMTDKIRLSQVLINLIGNALKFTPRGSIRIKTEVLTQLESRVQLQFSVIDTGIGIPEEKISNIFNEFTQVSSSANRKFGGTGLGLAITRKILKLFGTDIQVASKIGQGSTFSFCLNLETVKEQSEESPKLLSCAQLDGLRVLIAEDNEINLRIVTRYLKKWGIDYGAARNGQEALDLVNKRAFDLILMDLLMPDMDGYEASSRIRSLTDPGKNSIPIVALSASLFDDVKDHINMVGINGYLGKPFRPDDLHSIIVKYTLPPIKT